MTTPADSPPPTALPPRVEPRTRADACPGALRVHRAADGDLARVRLPGGALSAGQMQVLAEAARDLGDGALELTSRGNVQLRAVSDPEVLAERLVGAGLLPSVTHERVRNILASPLSGRIGGLADIRRHVLEVDRRLCANPEFAQLPGRFLVSIDDGRGDVSGHGADVGIHLVSEVEAALILAGADTGVRVAVAEAVELLIAAARAFLELRAAHWRLAEVPNGVANTLDAVDRQPTADPLTWLPSEDGQVGWLDQLDGRVTLGAGVPLGRLTARVAQFLAAIEKPLVVTPWRTILICDLEESAAEQVVRVLAPMGLIFDADSPLLRVSACTGRPGCDRALADVRSDLLDAVDRGELPVAGRQHWVGCERRCGTPRGEVTTVVATGDGYRVQ